MTFCYAMTALQDVLGDYLVTGRCLTCIGVSRRMATVVKGRLGFEQDCGPYQRQRQRFHALLCLVNDRDAHVASLTSDVGQTVENSCQLDLVAATNHGQASGGGCLYGARGARENRSWVKARPHLAVAVEMRY